MKNKKMWTIVITVFLIILILSRTSFEVRDEIEINASPEKVWNTIIDFKKYNEWNSQLFYLGGTIQLGGELHLKLAVEGTTPYEFKPILSVWEDKKRMAWIGRTGLPRIFDGEHFFELKVLGPDKTLLINREEYRGILSQLFRQLPMMKTAPRGFKKMNVELKNYIENQ